MIFQVSTGFFHFVQFGQIMGVSVYNFMIPNEVMEFSLIFFLSLIGVANGKFETLRDGETSIFLCETETFRIFRLRDQD